MAETLPSTMTAWVFSSAAGGIAKNLQLRHDIPLPPSAKSLKKDEVLVKTRAMALNPADYALAEVALLSLLIISKPASPGLDFSGTVVALGPNSGKHKAELKVGQFVFGRLGMPQRWGSLGQYLVCKREGVVPAPEGMSAEDAASISTAGLTALQALQPYVKQGDRVFINGGSGGVGSFAIQIAKILGCHVTVTCSSANVDLCKSLGADRVIDYRTCSVLDELKKSEHKYDLFIDNVGKSELYWNMAEYTTPGATFVPVSIEPSMSGLLDLFTRLITPTFITGPGRKINFFITKEDPEALTQIGQWVKEGRVMVVKDEVFSYSDAPRAFERLKTRRARGKIIITSEQ